MQLGMVGVGRMGANLVRRLLRGGHRCVIYDVNAAAAEALLADAAGDGADDDALVMANTIEEFVHQLEPPRALWIMVPAAFVGATVDQLRAHLQPGDIIIDGGNSYYRDDIDRAAGLVHQGIHYVDVGTSGGVFGLERGFCLMIGGEDDVVTHLTPLFRTIAPGVGETLRTPGRDGDPSPSEQGFLHCGPNGAGHFVKMVHNGIEYGVMAAYAEGLNILAGASIGLHPQEHDAETTPFREPGYYQFAFDVAEVSEVWRRGSVIASWLLDLTAAALRENPSLDGFAGRVSDSGEGRWTALAAIDEGVPAPVLTAALFERFASRGNDDFANKVLSAMRQQFGGHYERKAIAEGKDPDDAALTNTITSGPEFGGAK